MIPSPQNRQAYPAMIDFAKRDLFGYVTVNFHLTPQQTGVEDRPRGERGFRNRSWLPSVDFLSVGGAASGYAHSAD